VHVALVHETGAAKGRPARVRRWFPDADVVVFGHSHTPLNDWHDGQLLFNPGSAVERRREPVRSYGLLDLADGRVARHEIVLVTEVTASPMPRPHRFARLLPPAEGPSQPWLNPAPPVQPATTARP
jgi:hypothetical protein